MFVEGLAVAYEGMGSGPIKVFGPPATTDVRELAVVSSAELVAFGAYSIAGAFTAFLINRRGLDDYLRVYAAISRSAGYDSIDRAFREVFAETFEESVAAFEVSTKKIINAWRIDMKLMECSAPELAWDGTNLAVERSLSCDHEDAVGPYDDKVVVYHTIEIYEGGYYELRMAGDSQPGVEHPDFSYGNIPVLGVSLYICNAEGYWMATWVGSTPRKKYLGPGRYSIRFHGAAAEVATLGFTLKRVPDPPIPSP